MHQPRSHACGLLLLSACTCLACDESASAPSSHAGSGGSSATPDASLDASSLDAGGEGAPSDVDQQETAPIDAPPIDAPIDAAPEVIDPDQFATEREAEFALPLPYRDLADATRKMLQDYETLYLEGDPSTDFVEDATTLDCATNEPLTIWKKIYVWHLIGPLAETLYYGAHVFEGDPLDPTLADDCEQAVVRIADHVIDHANATEFGGATYSDPFDGTTKPFVGWNNFRGRWDAWSNGTCPPAGSPSTWASAWALDTLAIAHRLTGAERFRRALHRGISYYHQEKIGNATFAPGYAQYADALANLQANSPYTVAPLYTVGGNRFVNANLDPFPWSLHYHYKGEEDPVFNTLNVNATMGQALLHASFVDPVQTLPVAIPAGGFAQLTYRDVAWRVMYSVYANLANGNITYVDLDDVHFDPAKLQVFEAHLVATILHLSKAAGLLDNPYFAKTAVETVNLMHTAPLQWPEEGYATHVITHDQVMAGQYYRAICAARTLPTMLAAHGMQADIQIDPMQRCTEYLEAVPVSQRYYLWNLFSALYQVKQ